MDFATTGCGIGAEGDGMKEVGELLRGNRYPGRGIVVGRLEGGNPFFAYFIMGRSQQSRNRVFRTCGEEVRTRPFDERLVADPRLIIYRAVARHGQDVVVTNGDQTDTIIAGLEAGKTFGEALQSRMYEPDEPHYTPRISAILHLGRPFTYELSILRRKDGQCERPSWPYEGKSGMGHLIHTYEQDGPVLPSFLGEPRPCLLHGDLEEIAQTIWNALDNENRISLVTRVFDDAGGTFRQSVFNRQEGA